MPRTARKHGESGYYHVITKGDGGQVIFGEDRDRRYYLKVLQTCVEEHKVKLHAYCLMSNHVHLLLQCEPDELSAFMKQLNESYAKWFASVLKRKGHVFDGRFWSEPIENDAYLLSCIRYIHANPEHAGICPAPQYPWSSYAAYMGSPGFVTTAFALEMLSGTEGFMQFNSGGTRQATPFPKSSLKAHLAPDEIARVANAAIGHGALVALPRMKPKDRVPFIQSLSHVGLTERDIARVTGLGKTVVHKALSIS